MAEPLRLIDKKVWKDWLAHHHSDSREIWLIIRKKVSKLPGIGIDDAVEEALAYGWIDSHMKPLNSNEYLLRFTPRKVNSLWSLRNRRIAERLINEKGMKQAGLRQVEESMKNGRLDSTYSSITQPKVPADLVVG